MVDEVDRSLPALGVVWFPPSLRRPATPSSHVQSRPSTRRRWQGTHHRVAFTAHRLPSEQQTHPDSIARLRTAHRRRGGQRSPAAARSASGPPAMPTAHRRHHVVCSDGIAFRNKSTNVTPVMHASSGTPKKAGHRAARLDVHHTKRGISDRTRGATSRPNLKEISASCCPGP